MWDFVVSLVAVTGWTQFDVSSVLAVVGAQGQEGSVSSAVANNSEVGPSHCTLSLVRGRSYTDAMTQP